MPDRRNAVKKMGSMLAVVLVLALLALVIFGGEVIRSFTLAMLFGVIFGTYSSIFIAAPLLILFRLRQAPDAGEEKVAATGKAVATSKRRAPHRQPPR